MSRLALRIVVGLALVACLSALTAGMASADEVTPGVPTIATDRPDYAAGATVLLTGSGWTPSESVHISVAATDGQTWSLESGQSGAASDPIADDGGVVAYAFALPTTYVATYGVVATGAESGSATTTFTDGPANLWQCTNGGVGDPPERCAGSQLGDVDGFKNYVNGNANGQKAHWQEGEFLSYRDTMAIPEAGTYRFVLGYDNVEGSKHALDYIGSFDYTETTGAASGLHANQNDPCSEAGLLPSDCDPTSPASTFPIPAATFFPTAADSCGGASTGNITQIPGSMKIWGDNGPTITGVSYVTQNVAVGANNCKSTVAVTFTTTDEGTAVLAWGGHIASQADWGTGNSASYIPGSPYHMRQLDLAQKQDDGTYDTLHGVGNQDAQLATTAIYFTGSLQIATMRTHGGLYKGAFTVEYDCGGGFTGSVSILAGSSATISGIPGGSTCALSEPVLPPAPPGYFWTGPIFTPDANPQIPAGGGSVTVMLSHRLNGATGAQSMGYWEQSTGQAIVAGGSDTAGVCDSGAWLRGYAPFANLSSTATCAQVASYVDTTITAGEPSAASMKKKLKGQMLGTALNVYFSDPALGGNAISAPAPIGGLKIDTGYICRMLDSPTGVGTCKGAYANVMATFGGTVKPTVSAMLSYAASQSTPGGGIWYGNVSSTLKNAKDAFDSINNLAAFYS